MSENVGKKIFVARCAPCHAIGAKEKHKIGPNLFGFWNNRSCMSEGYSYSDALVQKGLTWNEETLHKFLENPKKTVPGTKMLFVGLKKPQEREDLFAYLKKMSS